jgi:tRNA (guanosine-2'-O-)-methyltransferase
MDPRIIDRIVCERGAQTVVQTLRPYLTDARAERIEQVLARRVGSVSVAIESPADAHNAAAVVRTAEALGIVDVHVITAEYETLRKRSMTKGAHHWVQTRHHADFASFREHVGGHVLAGAWPDAPLALEALPLERPLCLFFGNEQRGLSPVARAACTVGFRVPMSGMTESLNLSVCAAIALYVTLARKRVGGGGGDLSAERAAQLRARYYLHSVDARLADALFTARV